MDHTANLDLLLVSALLAAEGNSFSFNSKLLHRNQLKRIDPVHGEEDLPLLQGV